jgi:hypothetical protein
MAFTDDDVRALVGTGQYSDPAAADYLVRTLLARRDAIGRAYLGKRLALSKFRIEAGRVGFDDLAVRYGYVPQQPVYEYQWSVFDNEREQRKPISGARDASIPPNAGPYLVLDITAGNESRRVAVYLKQTPPGHRIVGIERVLQTPSP